MKRHIPLLLMLSAFLIPPVLAQPALFNEHITQPDVWRPAQAFEPGVDAKGDLNLSLPMVTVPGRNGLNFDIRFQYQSSIRVSQEPTWIGLGWSFDPGSITRDVQGGLAVDGATYNVDYGEAASYQPDIYYVTTPGGSFSMTRAANLGAQPFIPERNIDQHANPFVPDVWRPWKVEWNPTPTPVAVDGFATAIVDGPAAGSRDDFLNFMLTDETGTRYVFSDPTLSTYNGLHSDPATSHTKEIYVSIWRLVAILGPDYPGNPDLNQASLCLPPECLDKGSWIRFRYGPATTATDGESPTGILQTRYLTEVETPTHRALFNVAPRSDTYTVGYPWQSYILKRLADISLKAKAVGGGNDALIETVSLAHDYGHGAWNRNGRLRLNAINFSGSDSSTEPGYAFTYYGQSVTGEGYEDDFGYFNTEQNMGAGSQTDGVKDDGKAWSLRYLDHPTGGRTEILYENDEILDGARAQYYQYKIGGTSGGPIDFPFLDALDNLHQGGARVTAIKIFRSPSDPQPAVTTTFEYGQGHVSGVPEWYLQRLAGDERFFKATSRGKATVYYASVKRILADNTYEKTAYTTSPPLQTTIFVNSFVGGGDRTVITGNQHITWGIPTSIHWGDGNGGETDHRVVVQDHDLSTHVVTEAFFTFNNAPGVNIVWRPANTLHHEQTKERDGATLWDVFNRSFSYESPLQATPPGTGLLQKREEYSSGFTKRITHYTYGYEVTDYYDDTAQPPISVSSVFEEAHRLSAVVRTDVEGEPRLEPDAIESLVPDDPDRRIYATGVTVWKSFAVNQALANACPGSFDCVLHPYRRYQWVRPEPVVCASGCPFAAFTTWNPQDPPAGVPWQLQTTFAEYDDYGHITKQRDALDRETRLVYGVDNGCLPDEVHHNAYLTCIERSTPSVTLRQTMAYEDRLRLEAITDSNGNTTSYTYDPFGRLATVTNTDGLVARHAYDLNTSPPFVASTLFRDGAAHPVTHTTKTFFDGLSRPIQTQSEDVGNDYVVSTTEYDPLGRAFKVWKPYRAPTGGSYDPDFDQHAQAEYNGASHPFVETVYEQDGLSRVARTIPPHHNVPASVSWAYGVDEFVTGIPVYRYTRTTDESGRVSTAYVDGFGNTIRINGELNTATEFVHGAHGNVLVVMPPNFFDPPSGSAAPDWLTRYTYNTLGQLTEKSTPDADGDHDDNPADDDEVDYAYRYDAVGNLRFVVDPNQNPNQGGSGYIYTEYDAFNRVVETGRCTAGNPDLSTGCSSSGRAEQIFYTYDDYGAVIQPLPSGVNTSNSQGQRVQVRFENNQNYYQFFYDGQGRVVDLFVHLDGLDNAGEGKLIKYAYDFQGNVTGLIFQPGDPDEELVLAYTYDAAGRLKEVTSETPHDTGGPVSEAHYAYRPTGQVETLQLGPSGQLEPVEYVYHLRDWLTQINDPGFIPAGPPFTSSDDLFAVRLAYEANGNVKSMEWATAGNATFGSRVKYDYTYDALNRLGSADFMQWDSGNNNWQDEQAYDVGFDASGILSPIAYDGNGNIILSLHRWLVDDDQQPVHGEMVYNYANGNPVSNRLQRTTMDGTPVDYAYDRNGNMTKSRTSDPAYDIAYDRRNLPTSMPLPDGFTLTFRYDADGQRIYKKLVDSNDLLVSETFYVRGVDGSVLAVYHKDSSDPLPLHLKYWNILAGGTVLGRIEPPTGN